MQNGKRKINRSIAGGMAAGTLADTDEMREAGSARQAETPRGVCARDPRGRENAGVGVQVRGVNSLGSVSRDLRINGTIFKLVGVEVRGW